MVVHQKGREFDSIYTFPPKVLQQFTVEQLEAVMCEEMWQYATKGSEEYYEKD